MVEGLRSRLQAELDRIELRINLFNVQELTGKPLVLWMHHNVDQHAVQWCRDNALVSLVRTFVFVSQWQMTRYIQEFGLSAENCVVLRNAIAIDQPKRQWNPGSRRRIAYVSTPFRGLDVLLDAWDELKPERAELHIWSSLKLYGGHRDDQSYAELFERANVVPDVFYRGIVPNEQLKHELLGIDYLAYPSTFEETSCLSVIESLVAGCRVICPSLGALPETVGPYARLYPFQPNRQVHASLFASILEDELVKPWEGNLELADAQQNWAHDRYDWIARVGEWQALISQTAGAARLQAAQ